jgi:hypothetical protein
MPRGETTPPGVEKSAGLPCCSKVNSISVGNFQACRVIDDIRVVEMSLGDT